MMLVTYATAAPVTRIRASGSTFQRTPNCSRIGMSTMAATARQCQMNQKAKGGVFSFTFSTRSSSGVRN